MLTILETDENYLATRVTDKIVKNDYQKLLPIVYEQLQQGRKIRWYFEIEDFEGWEQKGLYEELNFDIKHGQALERLAMVGERKWTQWLWDLMKPFTSAKVKHFAATQKQEARAWLLQ